jgi:ferredoxin hydrogenase
MFTSCCPAWVRFAKLFYPDILRNISTAKSPIMMQGALVKTWFAQKTGIKPEQIVHVALAPCTAKKAEILLPGMNAAGVTHKKTEMRDVDIALTCREISYLLDEGKVNFQQAKDAQYSSLMGAGSGAGMIFGNTGGVMEAALRTAYKLLNDKNPPAEFLDLRPVRGFDSIRQASVDLGKRKLDVAVVHGAGAARPLIESILSGARKLDFVEVMACPGGCIGGGGQPINFSADATRLKQLRLNALYQQDAGQKIRLSCDNPQIKEIYDEFLGKPLGKKSEELLHVPET